MIRHAALVVLGLTILTAASATATGQPMLFDDESGDGPTITLGPCVGPQLVQCLIDGDRYVGVCSEDGTIGDDRHDRYCLVDATALDGASMYRVCALHAYGSGESTHGDTWGYEDAAMCAHDGSLCEQDRSWYEGHHGERRHQSLERCPVKVGTPHNYLCVLYDSQYWSDEGGGFHETSAALCVGGGDDLVCALHSYYRSWGDDGSDPGTESSALCLSVTP